MDEFDFIEKLKHHFNFEILGDDCAVLPFGETDDLLITTDILVEDIDFRFSWSGPNLVGHKALAVSLSDLAAMAGEPVWAFFSVAVPELLWNEQFMTSFYEGINTLAEEFSVSIAGGDMSGSKDKFLVDCIVAGRCPRGTAVLRSGARPGDLIFVSGTLGGAQAGLRFLENGVRQEGAVDGPVRRLIKKQLQPRPEVTFSKHLGTGGLATSLIDISDGLSSDLLRLCRASKTGAVIEASGIPLDPDLDAVPPEMLRTGETVLDLALHGGEDFRLLFTVSPEDRRSVEAIGGIEIGRMVNDEETYEIVKSGDVEKLEARGFDHFRE